MRCWRHQSTRGPTSAAPFFAWLETRLLASRKATGSSTTSAVRLAPSPNLRDPLRHYASFAIGDYYLLLFFDRRVPRTRYSDITQLHDRLIIVGDFCYFTHLYVRISEAKVGWYGWHRVACNIEEKKSRGKMIGYLDWIPSCERFARPQWRASSATIPIALPPCNAWLSSNQLSEATRKFYMYLVYGYEYVLPYIKLCNRNALTSCQNEGAIPRVDLSTWRDLGSRSNIRKNNGNFNF